MELICFGDSLTFGQGVPKSHRWSSLFAAESGWRVLNRGVCGDTTGGMLSRFQQDVISALGETPASCRVLLMGGTNDIFFSGTNTNARANFSAMAYQLKAHGIRPIIGTPMPVDWPQTPNRWQGLVDFHRSAGQIEAYTAWLREYCRRSNVLLADFSAAFCQPNGQIRHELLWDGIHPSEMGHRCMFNVLKGLLLCPRQEQGNESRSET